MAVRLDSLRARRVLSGHSVSRLAALSNTSDQIINRLEAIGTSGNNKGGSTDEAIAARILDVLGSPASVAVTSSSVANPSQITVASNTWQTGDSVTIAGHSGSTPSINATHIITRVSSTAFTIPVNVTIGGTGGTATWEGAISLGLARL